MVQDRPKRGKGTDWRAIRLSGGCPISPFCLSLALLVIAVPSHAKPPHSSMATSSKYSPAYSQYLDAPFWRKNVAAMGDVPVTDGFAIWNTSGTQGPGVVSESVGYAMILAALYDDQATFDRLSDTVQAGIADGRSKGNVSGLFPWYWLPKKGEATKYSIATKAGGTLDNNSASDADINIALGYVYADIAVQVYGWSDPSRTYKTLASKYIAAIRQYDFSTTDTNPANNHVLADGFVQAKPENGLFADNTWHPDYSDIRAYQLFQAYDRAKAPFWHQAITIAISCWKAIFHFGPKDNRTENAARGPIDSKTSFVMLSNPTYQKLEARSDYSQVKAIRGGKDDQVYTADSQRFPIRILNYINAKENGSHHDMLEVASANLTALGTSYTKASYRLLPDTLSIRKPWAGNGDWIQNYTAAGLLAYVSNTMLKCGDPCNAETLRPMLSEQFGTNGIDGTVNWDLKSDDGFNASLTLWGLTVSKGGETHCRLISYPSEELKRDEGLPFGRRRGG